MYDLVIRDARLVDGTGAPARHADVGISGDHIAEIGEDLGPGRRELDAEGRLLTPGWVDVHSHYDGQATWDPLLAPSGPHGVTTAVLGNCGIGFAPARPSDHEALITLMEGVEDIPGAALAEGLPWTWETFPEYLDHLDRMPNVIDLAALVPHAALRAYVMGAERSIRDDGSPDDVVQMAELTAAAMQAGAIGMSTSRTKLHRGSDGGHVPGSFAAFEELVMLGAAVGRGGGGVIQVVCDWSPDDPAREFAWLRELATISGQPVAFTLVQFDETPDHHHRLLELLDAARADGVPIFAGVGTRPVGMVINLDSRVNPFSHLREFAEIADRSLAEKARILADPEFRARLLASPDSNTDRFWGPRMRDFEKMFVLGDPPDYEPPAEKSVAAIAARTGKPPREVICDVLCAGGGSEWLLVPLMNYSYGDLSPALQMMRHPGAVVSLADGGAHCGLICDASAPTFQLTHWVFGRDRGPRLSLEEAVAMQSGRTAAMWGFCDRGTVEVGKRADLNLIDLDRLRLHPPRFVADLPAGGRRLLQDADGYVATFLGGVQTWSDGEPTGERPGRLVRSITPATT